MRGRDVLLGCGVVFAALFAPASALARRSGEYVPRSARILRVTWGSPEHESLLVTNRSKVRRIAGVINNDLEVAPSDFACSEGVNFGPPSIWFTFRARPDDPKLAETFGLDSTKAPWAECILTRFSVRNYKPVFLIGGGSLITQAGRILGRRLH